MVALLGMKAGRISAVLERMSDRERKIVFGGLAMMLLAGMVLTSVLVSRKVSALEEEVTTNEASLREISTLAPTYLQRQTDEKAVDEQLERASKESLQATVLGIAKQVQFERTDSEGSTTTERLSDTIKFSNAAEILAELTHKQKKGAKHTPKKQPKSGKQVFLASIDAVFQGVPDEALMRFLAKLETHADPMFGVALDISRSGTNRDQFQATVKIGQFRYGNMEDSE